MKALLAIVALALFAATANADTVWSYTGNTLSYPLGIVGSQPITETFALTGSVTLDDGAPVAWDFTAGDLTLTNLNSTASILHSSLLGSGSGFNFWNISVTGSSGWITSIFEGSLSDAQDEASNGFYVRSDPGSWTEAVGTPEPGTLALLSIGLVGLLTQKRKKPRPY